ncbi:MAG: ComEA family DNA-binding protein [Chloroflexi bacterium]|nr:ComEA family DNA-binding protein [Chloroflexota bacterium]
MTVTRIGLIVIAIVAAVAAAYASFQALDFRSAPPIVIEDASGTHPVVVDVRGAVQAAGVYELPPGARVQDAITAAGGLAVRADLSTINLARRLRDGEAVTILELPAPGNTPPAVTSVDQTSNEASRPRININTATAEELDVLPGVGEVTAARIIAYREQNGPFRSVDDLIHVEGIAARTIDAFRDMVTIGP